MVFNTVLFNHAANFPHLQDGNLGPDPIPTAGTEKTSIAGNGLGRRPYLKFLMCLKFTFQQIIFPLLLLPNQPVSVNPL